MWGNPTIFDLLKKMSRKDKYWKNQLRKTSIDQSIDPLTTNNAIYRDLLTLRREKLPVMSILEDANIAQAN